MSIHDVVLFGLLPLAVIASATMELVCWRRSARRIAREMELRAWNTPTRIQTVMLRMWDGPVWESIRVAIITGEPPASTGETRDE